MRRRAHTVAPLPRTDPGMPSIHKVCSSNDGDPGAITRAFPVVTMAPFIEGHQRLGERRVVKVRLD